MATLEIICAPQSNFVRTVRMACEEKGVPYTLSPARPQTPEVAAIHPFGKMPEDGEPKALTPFPEMDMGWTATGEVARTLMDEPEWQYAATIDPEFARRTAAFVDHCLTDRRPGREL